ncbi:hypothetical protein LOK49_LG11G01186 [Camellia lanceoleosa]|uniref:Uncharacterized protein n=1 Tax=Camellia lanceoleosa TaxID=1840588 RepID=A0ACC0G6K6_9ERIC|nr:hypothetical protein LOK49_LG11G01186 [Camellia lanceoleosa]
MLGAVVLFVFAYQLAIVGSIGIYTPFVKFDLYPSPKGMFLYFYGWMLLGDANVAWQLVLLVEVGLLLPLLLVGLMLLQCCCEVVAGAGYGCAFPSGCSYCFSWLYPSLSSAAIADMVVVAADNRALVWFWSILYLCNYNLFILFYFVPMWAGY